MSTSDSTVVTGSPRGRAELRPGDVLAERYELLERLVGGDVIDDWRGVDQETERPVLVRTLAGAALEPRIASAIAARLRGLAGVGGRHLAPLIDAEAERGRPFTVEDWPRGEPIARLIEAKRAQRRVLAPSELLPILAALDAAVRAVPEGFGHGDVTAERLWLDPLGHRLTGGFFFAALPAEVLAPRLVRDGAAPRAPEVLEGHTQPASDRWGVAALAWLASTGRPPGSPPPAPGLPGRLEEELAALLHPNPDRRPATLARLLAAYAEVAELPVPSIDPEAHRPPTAHLTGPQPKISFGDAGEVVAAEDGTQRMDADDLPTADPEGTQRVPFELLHGGAEGGAPEAGVEGAGEGGTARAPQPSFEPSRPLRRDATTPFVRSEGDTAPHAAITDEPSSDELDPRLVRAALGIELASSEEAPVDEPSDELDPRLVRAALGVSIAEDSAEESDALELEPIEEDVEELEELEVIEAPRRSRRAAPAPTPGPSVIVPPEPDPPRGHEDILPLPPAGAGRGEGPHGTGSAGGPPPRPSPASGGGRTPPPIRGGVSPSARAMAKKPARTGLWIILAAIVLALVILGAGLFIASQRRRPAPPPEVGWVAPVDP